MGIDKILLIPLSVLFIDLILRQFPRFRMSQSNHNGLSGEAVRANDKNEAAVEITADKA